MFFGTVVPPEPFLTTVLPELKECSLELSLSYIKHNLVCEVSDTVLYCYAHLASTDTDICQYMVILGSYNFI